MTENKTEIATNDLMLMVEKEKKISDNWQTISQYMSNEIPFCVYLKELVSNRDISIAEVGKMALLSRSFTYQIFSGDRVPTRDIILRIALSLELSTHDTEQLLKLADRGTLYPKIKRDAVIINGIANRHGLYKTDETLIELGLEPLL